MGGGDDDDDRLLLLHLPEDLMIEILLLLPIVSLLRFKTVCKSWRSLIGSHDFLHPKHDNSKLGTIIFQSVIRNTPYFFLLSGNVDFEVVEELGLPPYLVDADFSSSFEGHVLHIVGSCHGIICLHDALKTIVHYQRRVVHDAVLWNPVTKQSRILPRPPVMHYEFGKFFSEFYAFGFDVESKDYKVLLVTSCMYRDYEGDDRFLFRVQVYNLSTNSWRYLDNALSTCCEHLNFMNQGRYLNGYYFSKGRQFTQREEAMEDDSVHCYSDYEYVILSFDFGKEKFRTIPPPNECFWDMHIITEKLACTTGDYKIFEVWVLDDYLTEVRPSSWTKLYRMGPYTGFGIGPTAFSRNGELCLLRGEVLQLWNSVTRESKYCQFDESVRVQRSDVYKRSLVSIS